MTTLQSIPVDILTMRPADWRTGLSLDRNRFIIYATDLTDEQANGLTAMYEPTFVSLGSLGKKLQDLL